MERAGGKGVRDKAPAHVESERFPHRATWRTAITFDQAKLASEHGFGTRMQYVALSSAVESIARVRTRAESGGHSAPPEPIRDIYEASLKNLLRAPKEFHYLQVFDNSDAVTSNGPTLVLETVRGRMMSLAAQPPEWAVKAFCGTTFDIDKALAAMRRGTGF